MRIVLLTWLWLSCLFFPSAWGKTQSKEYQKRIELRERVRDLFEHGYHGYTDYAYPADELKPVSCGPSARDPDKNNIGVNDIHANVSMTLLDTLSTLPILLPDQFPEAVKKVAEGVSFDQDVKVQVFEMTIRALGGLLSTYQYLERLPEKPKDQAKALGLGGKVDVKQYAPRILELALDLGHRMAPAFKTATGIPYSRVNLRYGLEDGESEDTCIAGAGSLVLEFAVLSRLTGNTTFEALAHRAYMAVWERRSEFGLLGNTIGAQHGQWLSPGLSGVQAGMDSYFEYAMKAAILLDDERYAEIFDDAYAAIQTHVRTADGFIYRPIHFRLLQVGNPSYIDSLSAFFAGVQVLAGDIESAIRNHLVHWNVWRRYNGSPEAWTWTDRSILWAGWPGRPEFVESTYYLYQATKDPFYLRVGERVLNDMSRVKTKCGFATMKNIETGELEDRMESFVLSELFKYLYLLFDPTDPSDSVSNQVFSTEGQLLSLPHLPQPDQANAGSRVCPAYVPPSLNGLTVGIEQRNDYEYARSIVYGPGFDGRAEETGKVFWSPDGYCSMPAAPRFAAEISLSPNATAGDHAKEVNLEGKVSFDGHHYHVSDVTGITMTLHWRFDNTGYDIAKIGPLRVHPNQLVFVSDPSLDEFLPIASNPSQFELETHNPSEVMLRFSMPTSSGKSVILHATGGTATFGRDFGTSGPDHWGIGGEAVQLVSPKTSNHQGCKPFKMGNDLTPPPNSDFVIVLTRGDCTFSHKLRNAEKVGASGVLVVDEGPVGESSQIIMFDQAPLIRPAGDPGAKKDGKVGMVFTTHLVGSILKKLMVLDKKTVQCEIMKLNQDEIVGLQPSIVETDMGAETGDSGRGKREKREGRLALGEWSISNLRIVEPP